MASVDTLPNGLVRKSDEVFLASGPVCSLGAAHIAFLEQAVRSAPRGRVRINLHGNGQDSLHQMLIALVPQSYIRPHKHPGKSESFHIIKGLVDVVVFDEQGDISDVVTLCGDGTQGDICYRMSQPLYHTLLIHSDMLVLHEITDGPFVPDGSVFASFSPEEQDAAAATSYASQLRLRVSEFKKQHGLSDRH
jgi:cupin fold WbuC family metalloprotein